MKPCTMQRNQGRIKRLLNRSFKRGLLGIDGQALQHLLPRVFAMEDKKSTYSPWISRVEHMIEEGDYRSIHWCRRTGTEPFPRQKYDDSKYWNTSTWSIKTHLKESGGHRRLPLEELISMQSRKSSQMAARIATPNYSLSTWAKILAYRHSQTEHRQIRKFQ